tara:strand:+ start:1943 stop:2389 length:447 start_codon:yes stop_codon:yes gene_type:complete
MIVVPFETWHFDFLELQGPEAQMKDHYGDSWDAILQYWKTSGFCWSWFEAPNKILGVCGINKMWNGVGEAYMFLSPEFKKNKIRCIKDIRYYLKLGADQMKLHRVHCYVLKSWDDAERFAKFLGFHIEAELHDFGPNKENYLIMARKY